MAHRAGVANPMQVLPPRWSSPAADRTRSRSTTGPPLAGSPARGGASSGDPAIERVLAELLDDPAVSGRLAELVVRGDRVGRARLLDAAGLVVHTSIDRNAQAAATSAAAAVVAPGRVGAAIVAMEQTTGRIVALHGPVDVARQAGGAFLPFTMAAALEAGVSATEPLAVAHQTDPPGSSESAGGDAEDASAQSASMTDALMRSANVPWVQLVKDGRLSVEAVMKLAQRAGVVDDESPASPSSVLGVSSVTPLRLASGYAMVAAGGARAVPHSSIASKGQMVGRSTRRRHATVTGRTWPARIWKLFVQGALPGEDRGVFPNPARASRPVDSGSRRPHLAG